MSTQTIITKEEMLQHWLEHRNLTRKTIEKFPEQELFAFNIGNMRTFADLAKELITIAAPGLREIVNRQSAPLNHDLALHTKEALLKAWDESTPEIVTYYNQIPEEQFHEERKLFGEYDSTIINHILYFIDNEIHHRGQGFVYLRALNIEPPFFWDRY